MLRLSGSVGLRCWRASPFRAQRWHSHSHGHKHGHGTSPLLEGGGLKNAAARITWAGLVVNVGMAVGKGVGGVVFHSQSLIADALHAVADLVSDFLTLATLSYTKRQPSRYFPDGYGRIEAMGTLGVSALLIYAGASMGWTSLLTTIGSVFEYSPWLEFLSAFGHSHSHGGGEMAEWNAAWIALGSIVIKEALFQATYRIGKRDNSSVLIANAWHHRVDSLASIVAVVAIASGQLFHVNWLDPLGGLIVSVMILRAGIEPAKSSFLQLIGSNREIMESPEYDQFLDKARTLLHSISSDFNVTGIQLMPYGPNYAAYMQLVEAPGISTDDTFKSAEMVASELQRALLETDSELKHVAQN